MINETQNNGTMKTMNINMIDGTLTAGETANIIFARCAKNLTESSVCVLNEIKAAFTFGEIQDVKSFLQLQNNIEATIEDYCFDEVVTVGCIRAAFDCWANVSREILKHSN